MLTQPRIAVDQNEPREVNVDPNQKWNAALAFSLCHPVAIEICVAVVSMLIQSITGEWCEIVLVQLHQILNDALLVPCRTVKRNRCHVPHLEKAITEPGHDQISSAPAAWWNQWSHNAVRSFPDACAKASRRSSGWAIPNMNS